MSWLCNGNFSQFIYCPLVLSSWVLSEIKLFKLIAIFCFLCSYNNLKFRNFPGIIYVYWGLAIVQFWHCDIMSLCAERRVHRKIELKDFLFKLFELSLPIGKKRLKLSEVCIVGRNLKYLRLLGQILWQTFIGLLDTFWIKKNKSSSLN